MIGWTPINEKVQTTKGRNIIINQKGKLSPIWVTIKFWISIDPLNRDPMNIDIDINNISSPEFLIKFDKFIIIAFAVSGLLIIWIKTKIGITIIIALRAVLLKICPTAKTDTPRTNSLDKIGFTQASDSKRNLKVKLPIKNFMVIKLNNIATIKPKLIPIQAELIGRYNWPTAKLTKNGDHNTAVFIPLIDASPAACRNFIVAFLAITDERRGNVPIFKTPPRICEVTCKPDKIFVEVKFDRSFWVFSTEGIVMAVDLSNHRLGRKAEKIIKKLPAFNNASSLGISGKINQVDINKSDIITLVPNLDRTNIKINNAT